VGGAIYTKFVETMRDELGVTGSSLDKLLRKLHFTAVEELGKMWKHRRALLHNKLGTTKARSAGYKRTDRGSPHRQAPPHMSGSCRKSKRQKT
jgi:hypothetical protein